MKRPRCPRCLWLYPQRRWRKCAGRRWNRNYRRQKNKRQMKSGVCYFVIGAQPLGYSNFCIAAVHPFESGKHRSDKEQITKNGEAEKRNGGNKAGYKPTEG